MGADAVLKMASYNPLAIAAKRVIDCPILLVAPALDTLCPLRGARCVIASAEKGEIEEIDEGKSSASLWHPMSGFASLLTSACM